MPDDALREAIRRALGHDYFVLVDRLIARNRKKKEKEGRDA